MMDAAFDAIQLIVVLYLAIAAVCQFMFRFTFDREYRRQALRVMAEIPSLIALPLKLQLVELLAETLRRWVAAGRRSLPARLAGRVRRSWVRAVWGHERG